MQFVTLLDSECSLSSVCSLGPTRVHTVFCQVDMVAFAFLKSNAGVPATLSKERVRIGHLKDFANGLVLVGGMKVVRFNDAISDPIAEIRRLFRRGVV